MKNKFVLILALVVLSHIGVAQEFDKAKLDSYFNGLETNNKFMGSVAVSKDGSLIYTKAIGFADIENEIKADENTKYRIGSITKTFTAVLIFKAIEEGKLKLDQTIDAYFPELGNADKITISHLLYHRSGIHNFTNDEVYLTYHTVAKSEKEMLEIIAKGGSDFTPDSKADYSNSNYVLLTYILEKTFQKKYGDLLTEYITKPIGLTSTYLDNSGNDRESKSYRFDGDWKIEAETDVSIPLGAGGIVSTPSDLVKFSDALFSGKLIKKESLEQMKSVKENFGIGLFPIPFYESQGYGHTGGIDGFTSVFSNFADANISYALTSNGTNFNNNSITIAVLSAVFDKPYEVPTFTTFEVNPEDLDKYVGVYSSPEIPLKITISKDGESLFAQATGQMAFPLEATEKDKFKFDQAGIIVEFNTSENSLILKQGGGVFSMKKE